MDTSFIGRLRSIWLSHVYRSKRARASFHDASVGQDIGGEGLASLTRAFTCAGARSVLASLWRVSDASTEVLMRRFYRELRARGPKDEALQRAQAALIHDKRYALPFHWAAFQLSGDWK